MCLAYKATLVLDFSFKPIQFLIKQFLCTRVSCIKYCKHTIISIRVCCSRLLITAVLCTCNVDVCVSYLYGIRWTPILANVGQVLCTEVMLMATRVSILPAGSVFALLCMQLIKMSSSLHAARQCAYLLA